MFLPIAIVALAAAAIASPTSRGQAPARLQAPLAGRIIGGENATVESHPYQASMQMDGEHACGAVIIGKNWLLTAGHCVTAGIGNVTVRAGSSLVNQGGSVHRVLAAYLHERYQTNEHYVVLNDIGLLRVEEAFEFDETRQPIELFAANEQVPAGASAVVSGWGVTDEGTPVQLQSVVVPMLDKQLCDRAYESFDGLPPGQICAGFYGLGGKDSCVGDSGGPLVVDGRLAGIVSWGEDCALPEFPGVYSEVAYFRDWIDKHF